MTSPTATTPAAAAAPFSLRPAVLGDVGAIVQLIQGLAEFENLTHLVRVTPEKLRPHLFGEKPVAEAWVAEVEHAADAEGKPGGREVVAFALFFTNFSTFLAQPGLYLEDLYVKPERRGAGIGEALLKRLAQLAVERGCGRFEWSVLDWNAHAIRFYETMGATVMPDWRICRVTGDALTQLGAPGR
ncbi:MAG TPA: GNAT family N-acetyltransferase [Burkholderiaceae bacterium]